ncbi:MAG: Gfo/Idh/MocA family oxidoreductase [Immundisolibacterales bacterium]|nr:Gfo/Idh/MocA family oxidoreductase [Immundisolibacterales bacterium]
MTGNPVIEKLGRRLRLGVIGGGPGSVIGEVHRTAARLDDRYEVVGGVLSSNPERSRAAGRALGFAPERAYEDVDAMLAAETARPDGVDVVAIMTPNDGHYPLACRWLDAGRDVICDKPLTTKLDDARDLVARVRASGLVFCTTYNYSGFPMVRQARAMVADGEIGELRLGQVEYIQPQLAVRPDLDDPDYWRFHARRSGPSAILGDIGTHAWHLLHTVTRMEPQAVAADIGPVMPGRRFDDTAGVLIRYPNGARGILWVTQAAAGAEHGLKFRIHGAEGGLEWHQEDPTWLVHMQLEGPRRMLSRNGPGLKPAAERASRIAVGHPEGFHEAFANLYSDVAEAVAARLTGTPADPLALDFPTVEDGARGMAFIAAAKASSDAGGAWTDCRLSL